MPITANSHKIAYGVQQYVFNTKQQLDELFIGATEKGSEAFIITEGKTYILDDNRDWVVKNSGGGIFPPFPDTIVYDGGLEEDHDTEKTIVYDGGLEV